MELMAFKFLSDHNAPSKQFCDNLISRFHTSALNSCAAGGHQAVMKEVAMRVSQLQDFVLEHYSHQLLQVREREAVGRSVDED